jgi:transketolase
MNLETKAAEIRRTILETALANGKGHVASALSWVEIAVVLHEVMKPEDRLVLSKTHGHLTLDALWPDPDYPMWPGWPHKCSGSLGMGLGMAAGMALANKLDGKPGRVFCVLGDAELHEGAIWEAVMFSAHHQLSNLIAIVDDNGQACASFTGEILNISPLDRKFQAFGWDIFDESGHNISMLRLRLLPREPYMRRPLGIVARTIKGRGISYMEGNPKWHHQIPKGDEIAEARKALA